MGGSGRYPCLVVAGIVWRDKTSFLAVQRPQGRRHAGSWEFPGGKVEPGERLEDALQRELSEEIGIVARQWSFWKQVVHPYPHVYVDLRFFHVTLFDNVPAPCEGQTLRWVTADEGLCLPFLDADRPLLEELAAHGGLSREPFSPEPRGL